MPAVAKLGSRCTGHGSFPPRVCDEGSPNVFVNGVPVHRQGDHWTVHCYKSSCHDSTLASGSPSVFVNGKAIGRIGDPVACGSTVADGSSNVFAGNRGGGGSSGRPIMSEDGRLIETADGQQILA